MIETQRLLALFHIHFIDNFSILYLSIKVCDNTHKDDLDNNMIRYRNDDATTTTKRKTDSTKNHGRQQQNTVPATTTEKKLKTERSPNKNLNSRSENQMAIDAIRTSKHQISANNKKTRPHPINNINGPNDYDNLKDIRGDSQTNTDDSTTLDSTRDTLDLSLSTISADSSNDLPPHTPDLTNVSSFQSRDAGDSCSSARSTNGSFNTTIDFISLHPDIHITSESLTTDEDENDNTRYDTHHSDLTNVSSRIDTNRSLFGELDDTSSTTGMELGGNGNFMASTPRRYKADTSGEGGEKEENMFKPAASQRRERTIFEEIVETQTEIVVESTYEVETNNKYDINDNTLNHNNTEQIQTTAKEIPRIPSSPSSIIAVVVDNGEKDLKFTKPPSCNDNNNNNSKDTTVTYDSDSKDNFENSRNPSLLTDVVIEPSSRCNNKNTTAEGTAENHNLDSKDNLDRPPLLTEVTPTKPSQSDSKNVSDLTEAATSAKPIYSPKDNEISLEEEQIEDDETPLDESTLSLADGDVLDTTMDLKEAIITEQSEPLNMAKTLLYKDEVQKEQKKSPGVKRRKGNCVLSTLFY